MEAVIQSNPDTAEKIIKTELGYYRHTHKSDMIARPELFKLIRITHEERLENLFILLSDNQNVATLSTASVIDLPTDDDALQAIKVANINPQGNLDVQQQDESAGPETNRLCVIVWNTDGVPNWFLGYVKEKNNNGSFVVEHLERSEKGKNVYWKYPIPDDVQIVVQEQILLVKINGEWDIGTNARAMKFVLKNSVPIQNTFNKLLSTE